MTAKNQINPELMRDVHGKTRRTGFEIEFAGLSFDECEKLLTNIIGDEVKPVSAIEKKIVHPDFGDFRLELDWQFLKEHAKTEALEDDLVKRIGEVAGMLVPLELVFPPIAIDRLEEASDIVIALERAGATGTDDSLLYAFGVHINTEIPDLTPHFVSRYLKAYCILQDYLVLAHEVDPARRLSPYVDLYSPDYIDTVLAYDEPSMDTLIDDYLAMNPTRNRALDMLPMFSEIDEARVKRKVPDNRIKRRPTFHYRLPNCGIGTPGWSLMSEWNRWCLVEHLAHSEGHLLGLGQEYRQRLKADQFATDADWASYVKGITHQLIASDA